MTIELLFLEDAQDVPVRAEVTFHENDLVEISFRSSNGNTTVNTNSVITKSDYMHIKEITYRKFMGTAKLKPDTIPKDKPTVEPKQETDAPSENVVYGNDHMDYLDDMRKLINIYKLASENDISKEGYIIIGGIIGFMKKLAPTDIEIFRKNINSEIDKVFHNSVLVNLDEYEDFKANRQIVNDIRSGNNVIIKASDLEKYIEDSSAINEIKVMLNAP